MGDGTAAVRLDAAVHRQGRRSAPQEFGENDELQVGSMSDCQFILAKLDFSGGVAVLDWSKVGGRPDCARRPQFRPLQWRDRA